jgi:hypothetical protein
LFEVRNLMCVGICHVDECSKRWRNALEVHIFYRDEWDGQGMLCVWGRTEVCTGCWWGSLRERDH